MFKLPGLPSPRSPHHELADFAELSSWDRGNVSKREILAYLSRIDENDENVGINDHDEDDSSLMDEVMIEIERRAQACGSDYPFELEHNATVLRHRVDKLSIPSNIYRYLLLSTRLNMKNDAVHDQIDGTVLLEEISATALRNYLGGTRSESHLFGTAVRRPFPEKVTELCNRLGEGSGYRSLDGIASQAQDDKLDVVAWVPFSDMLAGQLVIFAQCKTGTTYGNLVSQLRPDAFISKWMVDPLTVLPIRAFCVSEALGRTRWRSLCVDAGIVLDRCRLVDFSHDLPLDLANRMNRWTNAAKSTVTVTSQ